MDRATLAGMLDQTLLNPTAGYGTAQAWMERQRDMGFATLCVSPFLVPLASELLAGTPTRVCTVVGFPLGYSLTETKVEEARHLASLGAVELDMVINIAAVVEGEDGLVRDDVAAVVTAVHDATGGGGLTKVILETGYLTPEQITHACELCADAGADFVKTSTGFGPRGASLEDVALMRAAVGPDLGVKAAGGIRDLATALAMIEAGATRIGTSSGREILDQYDPGCATDRAPAGGSGY